MLAVEQLGVCFFSQQVLYPTQGSERKLAPNHERILYNKGPPYQVREKLFGGLGPGRIAKAGLLWALGLRALRFRLTPIRISFNNHK